MRESKARTALIEIAAREGVSVEEVRREIQFAIDEAMKNPDPAVRKQWEGMKFKGDKPTPEEFVTLLAKRAKRNSSFF